MLQPDINPFVHGAVTFLKIWYNFCVQCNKCLNKLVEKLYFLDHEAFAMQITAVL